VIHYSPKKKPNSFSVVSNDFMLFAYSKCEPVLFAYSKCEPGMTRGLNSDCMWIILDGIEPAIITFQIRAQFEYHVVFLSFYWVGYPSVVTGYF